MADKDEPQTFTVPACKDPSYANSSTVVGATAGAITGNPFVAIFGAVIGGLIGHKKMAIENAEGKEVKPPTMWNKGAFMGFALTIIAFGSGAGIGGILGVAALSIFSAWAGGKIVHSMQQKAYNEAREYSYMYGQYDPDKVKEQAPSPELPIHEQSQQQSLSPQQATQLDKSSSHALSSTQPDGTIGAPCIPAPSKWAAQEMIRKMEKSGAVGTPPR